MTDTAACSLIVDRMAIEREALVGALFVALGAVSLAVVVVAVAFSPGLSLPVMLGAGVGIVFLVHGILRRASAARADAALRAAVAEHPSA
ncbi:hypothetical protein [Microbacterium thalli]|uniref:Uncharacterized protein n=1 Tax=Microbacterium thalli TaxID=3027921 RepID=A0ABT5SEW2_9MICO|nr:hypothetical protein [Microbacterium thalli]MDD7961294.1 hypothetical protein [Microbacterium thalli]